MLYLELRNSTPVDVPVSVRDLGFHLRQRGMAHHYSKMLRLVHQLEPAWFKSVNESREEQKKNAPKGKGASGPQSVGRGMKRA